MPREEIPSCVAMEMDVAGVGANSAMNATSCKKFWFDKCSVCCSICYVIDISTCQDLSTGLVHIQCLYQNQTFLYFILLAILF